MTRHEALTRLMRGVGLDLRDYRALHALFDEQFDAALHHDPDHLQRLADRVTALLEALERRRVERVELVSHVAGPKAAMGDAVAQLRGRPREALESGWAELGHLVEACKRLNQRNGELLMDQRALMQRVLHGEAVTYAPP